MKRALVLLVTTLSLILAAPWAAAGQLKPTKPRAAPELNLPTLDGGRINLADLRGRVVLVNFWAVWCPPCRKEMPSMERLSKLMAGRPFTILASNAGETPEQIRPFLTEVPLTFPILLDQDSARMKAWRVFVLPTSFLVDKQGQIRYSLSGHIEWDEPEAVAVIEKLLAE
jgi:thiol-disulfide isomerase/thioredoxin